MAKTLAIEIQDFDSLQAFLISQICEIEKINLNGIRTLRNDIEKLGVKIELTKVLRVLDLL